MPIRYKFELAVLEWLVKVPVADLGEHSALLIYVGAGRIESIHCWREGAPDRPPEKPDSNRSWLFSDNVDLEYVWCGWNGIDLTAMESLLGRKISLERLPHSSGPDIAEFPATWRIS